MKAYLDLLAYVAQNGEDKPDRTGTGTASTFAAPDFCHDLSEGFPLLTTKKMSMRIVIHELIWMLTGQTNTRYLRDHGVTIWDEWADADGELGLIYGAQWRGFMGFNRERREIVQVDQIAELVKLIRKDPHGRRHIVTAWNPADLADMKLPPCHYLFQCYVRRNRFLDLKLNMRSIDIFLGLPYNIAFYALLTTVLASSTGYLPGRLIVSFGDLHIYSNHWTAIRTQTQREPLPLPTLSLRRSLFNPWELQPEDVELNGYCCHDPIKAPVAV